MPFRFASQTSIIKADNSCGNGGPNKAGLAPQCSILSTQPIYSLVRRRTMYTKLKQPAAYRNLTLWTCGSA
tara:strand:- start:1586 stop:1798 length:213 start_codon:yes stop_codon:yes gene_type:complete